MPIRVGKGNIYILLILKGGKPMNKKKKLLTVVTLVILMLEASVFTVSAADNHSEERMDHHLPVAVPTLQDQ